MIQKFILALFISFFTVASFAAIPANLDSQKWHDLVEQVQLTGKSSQYPNGIYLSASHIVPNDLTKPYVADYMSTVGSYDINGMYVVDHLEGVSEIVTIDKDGNWNFDQWIYVAGVDANLKMAQHRLIVKTHENMVTKVETIPATEADKLASWEQRLNEWFKLMPLSL